MGSREVVRWQSRDGATERLAAVWHNWQWFARHIWGEEVELEVD